MSQKERKRRILSILRQHVKTFVLVSLGGGPTWLVMKCFLRFWNFGARRKCVETLDFVALGVVKIDQKQVFLRVWAFGDLKQTCKNITLLNDSRVQDCPKPSVSVCS